MEHEERLTQALADRYRIEREIGSGGMATVYLAQDLKHNRRVAVKVLDPDLAQTLGAERFLREIETAANLAHPHILPLFDSGEADGFLFYVMPYVKGESLRARLAREKQLPVEDAVQITREIADALAYAHEEGVIHRDVKPANIMLEAGHAVLADFGVAHAVAEAKDERITRTGTSLGTPAYMSPEQATGEQDLDGRSDQYALGCMLYEMLAGEPPFNGSLEAVVSRKVLGAYQPLGELVSDLPPQIDRAVSKALQREKGKRFATAGEFRRALPEGLPEEAPKGWGRKRTVAAAAVVLLVVAAAVVAVALNRAESQRRIWAAQTLAEVEDLTGSGRVLEAYALALEVEGVYPEDTTLTRALSRISFASSIYTDPPGARVSIQDWRDPGGEWEILGTSPLEEVRFAGYSSAWEARPHRLRFELDGYHTRELLKIVVTGGSSWRGVPAVDTVRLLPDEPDLEGMVPLPGFTLGSLEYGDYLMGRYEVTNREYRAFVDGGGYQNPELWVHPFVRDGTELSFQEAMALFRDRSGRPGPSTWTLGSYPEGQGDYPVGGVSWFEAAAYARWAGKELPTTTHWIGGVRHYYETSYVVLPRSNLGSARPRPVGQNQAMSALGVYDLVGNVREWCYNEAGEGTRATRGAAWPDAAFHAGWIIPRPAFDRHETNGIRLMQTPDGEEALAVVRQPVERTVARDYHAEVPVSDAEFEVFRRLYSYDPFPLNPVVEGVDTLEEWIREKVSFDVPYGERGGVVLFLPRRGRPPFQPIVYWGGAPILDQRSSQDLSPGSAGYLVQDGRAVAMPLFKGAYERDDSLFSIGWGRFPGRWDGTPFRDLSIQWIKDLAAGIDYLETREDLDEERIGFYGLSWGPERAPIVLAVEPRIRAAVLNVGGLWGTPMLPEADPFHFLPRVRTPTLMINGRYDIVFSYESQQLPMFELLGTPEEDKRHYVSPASHLVPYDEVIRESLAWFDKYLGVPGGS